MSSRIAILAGPSATGKTELALEFATLHEGIEIVSADSVLVYRGLDVGAAKPSLGERACVRHHLIDIRDPGEPFTAGDFVREAEAAIQDIERRGNRPLIVGGTGFYLKALLFGLWAGGSDPELRSSLQHTESAELHAELSARDPDSAARIGLKDRYRLLRAVELLRLTGRTPAELQAERPRDPDPRFQLFVVDRVTEQLEARIRARTRRMLEEGLVEETRTIREAYPDARALGSVGYAQTAAFLDGILPAGRKIAPGIPGLESEIALATRQLVKAQRTWFRGQKFARRFTLDAERPQVFEQLKDLYGP